MPSEPRFLAMTTQPIMYDIITFFMDEHGEIMKILMEKQTPDVPNKPTDPADNTDVMNMLSGYLFASFYMPMNNSANTPAQQAGNADTNAGNNAVANDAPALQMSDLFNQLLQGSSSGSNDKVSENTEQSAADLLMQNTSDISQQTANQFAKTAEALDTVAKSTNDQSAAMNLSNAMKTFKQDPNDNHRVPQQTTSQKDQTLPETKLSSHASKESRFDPTVPSVQPNSQTTHEWQQPLKAWFSEINQQNAAPASVAPMNNLMTAAATSATTHKEMTPTPALQQNDAVITPNGKSSESLSFHLQNIEPVPGQRDVFELKIQVAPPELGPVQARLRMSKDRLEITILTNNSQTEQAIKQHLPQLTEKFQQSSMQLDIVVQQQFGSMSFDQGKEQQSAAQVFEYQQDDFVQPQTAKPEPVAKKQQDSNQLIDTYI